ncbi:uncharacterized protein LOC112344419 [Selaginella moellendorffii]|uniref:uncharacterized protein LOC112344419 n=1 Tax=Selaginella moellendorffii TaxID=88036 RepID=UPI000D1C5F03|nr:uncharacterized protein LOC112344419 [Selaginella moellendorffii]|eukprot:XP_024524889.1 uncharacterized protein LOC112344419 [Selaginella moellendorffii]
MAVWRGGTSAVIRAPIDKVWEATRDFAGILDWTGLALSVPGLEMTITSGEPPIPGCVRCFTVPQPDGGKIVLARETLLEFDEEQHRFKYRVDDHKVLDGYVATFALSRQGDGGDAATLLEWTYEIPADEADPSKEGAVNKEAMGLYHPCIESLKKILE